MNRKSSFARYLLELRSRSQAKARKARMEEASRMAIAISRQAGSGAVRIAEKLAEYLSAQGPADGRPWTVFDKNLITTVLEDHHWPVQAARFLPEDKINAINDMVDEVLGLHPSSRVIVQQSVETILKLAELGNAILVGRGASVITRRMPNVFRARLVGSLEQRLARVQELEHLDRKAALAFLRRTDAGRARYVKKYLHEDVADVLLYDLTINTDHLPDDEVVRLIGDPVLRRIEAARSELKQAA